MATGTTPSPTLPNDFTDAEQLIERQLVRVRRHIRFADFITALVLLTAGLLGFFVLAAVTDHWILGLGVWGRWIALLTVLAGVGWYLGTRLIPFLVMQINPAYAAQTIERSEPSLKNSLLNYLLLRRDPAAVHQRVYEAVRQRAAADVSTVAVDQTVDRSALIRAGYVLVGIMALAAAYKILSPKDPLQTARRIVSPWADIARPARVTIDSVEPGDAEFYHGQTVAVSAIVRGVRDVEPVTLVYSTSDGQTIDKHIPMKLDSSGFRHIAELPPDRGGLRSDLVYRLEAGDCVTRDFQIRAIAAPMIEVEAIEYEFPAYTQRPREVVQGQGDIHAVEGTRVTIRAKTNQTIRSALLEFDPTVSQGGAAQGRAAPGAAAGQPTPATERIAMEFRESSAWRNFRLELAGDRQSPRHSSYQLTFVNVAGRTSYPPVVYRIEVTPDLGPEIEFLSPTRERIEVPVSGEQKIEIRAIDPDYGLSRVRIKSIRGSTELFDKVVHESTRGQSGQVVTTFLFRPKELGLKADDQVTYWGVAEDNRTAVGSDSPEPNTARTRNYSILVVPDPKADPNRDPEKEKPAENPAGDDNKQDPPSDPSNKERKTDKQQPNEQKGPQEKPAKPEEKQNGKNEQKGQEGASSKTESGQEKQQSSPSSQQDGGGKQGGGSNQNTPDSKSQAGQGSQPSESGGNTPQQNGKGATGTSAGENPGGKGEQREGPSGNNRSEPAHDGEVFEKALRRMNEEQGTGKKNDGESTGSENAKGSDQNGKGPSDKEQEKAKQKPDPTQPRNATGAETTPKPGTGDTQNQPAGDSPSPDRMKKDAQQKEGEGAKHPDANQGEGKTREGAPGEGGKTARNGMERPEKNAANTKDGSKDGGKKPGLSDNGESGAGQNSKDKNGSGSVEEIAEKKIENRDRPKTQQPNSQEPMDPGDPASSKSQKQSDSQGGQSGDESGGGKQGSGQGAKQPGNDSAGSNSSSDDGAGSSKESGKGNTSKTGGDDRASGTPTGSSGADKGPGSKTSDSGGDKESGEKSGAGAGSSAPKSDQEKRKSDNTKDKGGSGSGGDGSSSTPTGGGAPADRPEGKPPADGGGQPGDAANLDYARRATDMVIDYLEHKKGESDQELMDEMGWKPGDLEAFLERWKKLKQSASENPASRRELEESLRSLGLRPTEDTRRTGGARSDDNRGLRESGVRSAPPTSYQEQYNAFKKGSSRGSRPAPSP